MLKAGLIWSGLLLPLMLYGVGALGRPAREAIANQPLFQGITYSRRIETRPRPQVIHILDIDLTAPGLKPFATPGFDGAHPNINAELSQESLVMRTSSFLQAHQLQLAVNANFFYPFREETLWNYSPKEGAPANLIGLAISEGEVVSLPQRDWPALCFLPQRAEIHASGDCPEGAESGCRHHIAVAAWSTDRSGSDFAEWNKTGSALLDEYCRD